MNNAQKTQTQRAQDHASTPTANNPPRSAYDAVNGQQRPVSSRTSSSRFQARPEQSEDDAAAASPRQRDRPFGRSNPPRMNTDFPPNVPPRAAPTAKRPEGASGAMSNDEAPFTEASRVRTPYASTPGEKTSFFSKSDSIRRTASVRDATKLDPRFNPVTGRPRSLSPSSRDGGVDRASERPITQPSRGSAGKQWMQYSESSDASSEEDDDLPPPRRASYVHGAAVNPADRPKAKPSTAWQKRSSEATPVLNKSKSYDDQNSSANAHEASHTFRPQPPDFQFSPADAPVPTFSPTPPRAGTPNSAYVFPTSMSSTDQMPPPPVPGQQASSEDEQSTGSGRNFRPEGWQHAFKQTNWASQWGPTNPQSKPASPTRPPANSARRTRSRPQSQVPPGAPVPAHFEQGTQSLPQSEDAMDIDDESPGASHAPAVSSDMSSDGSTTFASNTIPSRANPPIAPLHQPRRASASDRGPQPARSTVQGQAPLLPPPSTSSGPDLNLFGFRHALPGDGIHSNGAGMRNLSDLWTTLPFHSRPSPMHPAKGPLDTTSTNNGTDAETEAERISRAVPRPPLAPLVPSNLNKAHWDTYLAQMSDYVAKWNTYNARMVAHFQDTAVSLAEYSHPPVGGQSKVLDNWLAILGETREQKGWESYVRELKEDGLWRTAWAEASQRHAEAVTRHHNVRARLVEKMERSGVV